LLFDIEEALGESDTMLFRINRGYYLSDSDVDESHSEVE